MTYPSLVLGIVLSAPALAWSPKPVQVHGVVTDEAGKPLAGVTWRTSGIEEWRDGRWKLAFFAPPAQEHTTADNGRFTLEFPTTCRFDLQFDKWGYGPVFVYQVGPDSPEIQVKMRKGSLVQGRVRRTDKHVLDLGPTMVAIKLPNRRGVWYQKTTPVDHEGKFRFYVCPPPLPPDLDEATRWPPVPRRPDRPILWQIVCAGEVVQIDVEEGKPVAEVIFELTVTAKAARRFVYNLKDMRPSEFLSHLRALETGTCTVAEVRGAWVEERDLPGLFKLLDSEEKCASVVNAVWSPHVDMGKPTTMGREAGLLIKSFTTQQYPAPLGSTMSDADKQELRERWTKTQETPLQYKVQLRLVETGPDGQSRVLASSLVLTTEDKPEVVNADADVPLPKGVETTEPLHAGRSFSFRVSRSGGRLFIDARAELADVRSATEDGVRIATRGFRLVEAIALGKPATVPVDSGKTGEKRSLCWEILVSDPALEKMPPGSRPFPRPTGRLKPRPR